jgi:hypothetical protein
MTLRNLYPEARRYLDRYTADEVAARLPELLAYGAPITITGTGQQPWVLVPSQLYDTLISAWAGINSWIEDRRQQAEPLPPISV